MVSLFYVIDVLLGFLENMMLVYGVCSLLIFFGVLKPYGRITQLVWINMQGLFEPLLAPIRRYVPAYRGFDWSFMVLYLLIIFSRSLLREYGPLGSHFVARVAESIPQ
jgi:YggT family protein